MAGIGKDKLPQPVKKNPQLKTAAPLVPPLRRSRLGLRLAGFAARGEFCLPFCAACDKAVWPPRDACPGCLAELDWREVDRRGELIAESVLETSPELYFRGRMPWRIGTVQLACGPSIMAHLHQEVQVGEQVEMGLHLDKAQRAVFMAYKNREGSSVNEDSQLRELTSDPKYRRVLISDARSPAGLALARALAAAEAKEIFAGVAESWRRDAVLEALEALDHVTLVPLDLTDSGSVKELAAEIGGKVDILIHTADQPRPGGLLDGSSLTLAQEMQDRLVTGYMRLASQFGPAMRGRGADGVNSATAFVTVLSVYAHANWPSYGTHSACHAAVYSLSQCLRAEMLGSGVRVVNAYIGPLEQDWYESVLPPKLDPQRLARDLIKGLQQGLEDIYIGDVARDVASRFREDAKLLEIELTGGGRE